MLGFVHSKCSFHPVRNPDLHHTLGTDLGKRSSTSVDRSYFARVWEIDLFIISPALRTCFGVSGRQPQPAELGADHWSGDSDDHRLQIASAANTSVNNQAVDTSQVSPGGFIGGYSANGNLASGNTLRLDGANITDPGFNALSLQTWCGVCQRPRRRQCRDHVRNRSLPWVAVHLRSHLPARLYRRPGEGHRAGQGPGPRSLSRLHHRRTGHYSWNQLQQAPRSDLLSGRRRLRAA